MTTMCESANEHADSRPSLLFLADRKFREVKAHEKVRE